MASVLIPLDVASPFRATITACHPYVGPLSIGNADLDVMLARMGGVVPPAGPAAADRAARAARSRWRWPTVGRARWRWPR
jgi:hypothetical protein